MDGGRQAARPRGAETGRPPPASRAPASTSPVSPTHPGRSPSPDTPDGVPCLHHTLTSIKDRLFCSEWLRETHGSRFRPCLHLRTINNSPSSLLQGGMQGEGGYLWVEGAVVVVVVRGGGGWGRERGDRDTQAHSETRWGEEKKKETG